jgi:hypothetical protein
MSMKLFIVSICRSAVSTKSRIAADEIPWRSGVLRAKERELSTATTCRLVGRRGAGCAREVETGEEKEARRIQTRDLRMGNNILGLTFRERLF